MSIIKRHCFFSIRKTFFFVLIFLSSITLHNLPLSAGVPQWYTNPRPNSSIHMYEVGGGFSAELARDQALSNIAGFFQRTVASEEELREQTHFDDVIVDYRQEIFSEIQELELDNYETTRSAEDNGDHYVEVRLDCRAYAHSLEERVKTLQGDLAQAFRKTERPMVDFYRMHKARGDLNRARTYLHVLTLLDRGFAVEATLDFEEIRDHLREYDRIEEETRSAVKIQIFPDDRSRPIAQHLQRVFLDLGMDAAVMTSGSPAQAAAPIRITSSAEEFEVFGSKEVTLEIELIVRSSQGDLLSTNIFEKTATSLTSFRDALNIARTDLNEELQSLGLEALLGLE